MYNNYYRIAGKFGGLYYYNHQIKNLPKFPTHIYTYGDPVLNHQI